MNVLYEDFLKFWLVFMFIMFIINFALIKIKKSKFDWLSMWENKLALAEHLFSQQATPKTLIKITALSKFEFGIKRKSIRVIIKLKQEFWNSKVIWFQFFHKIVDLESTFLRWNLWKNYLFYFIANKHFKGNAIEKITGYPRQLQNSQLMTLNPYIAPELLETLSKP